jgi:outer membrane biosynthesis protein TonB
MAHDIEHLKREIESLEKQLAAQHFGGLFDRKRIEQLEDKLKKKRKELARLQAGDEHDDLDVGPDHMAIPEFVGAIEETPDLGPDFPIDIDADELPIRKPGAKSPAKPVAKTATKPVVKTAKKVAPKPKPAAKAKPKAKAKPAPKKKAAAKPTKKKSKR